MLAPWRSGATAKRVLVSVALAMLVVGGERAASQEEPADPNTLCQRFPERPECAIPHGAARRRQRAVDAHPEAPTEAAAHAAAADAGGTGACAAAEDVASGAARTGSKGTPTRICNCQKAQGTVRRYLRSPVDRSEQSPVIEVCETALDDRLDGVLVIPKDASHPSFAQAALDDLTAIASVSDPAGTSASSFYFSSSAALGKSTPTGRRAQRLCPLGAVPMRGKSGKTSQ